jgi:hypothetical protein
MKKIAGVFVCLSLSILLFSSAHLYAGHDPMGDILSIVPNRGHQGTVVEVTLIVKNRPLGPWDYLQFLFPGTETADEKISAGEARIPDPRVYTAKLTIAADAQLGSRDVRLNSA